MSKFCKYCGKELEDGMTCSCTGANQNEVIKEKRDGFLALFGKFVKSPVSVGASFVNNGNLKSAISLITVQSILVGLLVISLLNKYNSALKSMVLADEGFDTYVLSMLSTVTFPLSTAFFVSAISAFAIACMVAFALMLVVKLFRGNTSYKYMLCVSAINSLTLIPFVALGLLISLVMPLNFDLEYLENSFDIGSVINPIITPIVISCLGMGLANYITLTVLHGGSVVDKNKEPYIMFFTGILMGIATYFVYKIAIPMCLPSAFKTAYDALSNGGIEAFEDVINNIF